MKKCHVYNDAVFPEQQVAGQDIFFIYSDFVVLV